MIVTIFHRFAFLLIFLLIALINACKQRTSNDLYKSNSSQPNATLRYSGSKFQLSFGNELTDVDPEIEQIAAAREFSVWDLDTEDPLELSDEQTTLLFNIKIKTDRLSCQIDQTEFKLELSLFCSENTADQKPDDGTDKQVPPGNKDDNSPSSSSSSIQLITTQQTFIKTSVEYSDDLPDDQKCSVAINIKIFGRKIETISSHYKFTLDQDIQGCAIGKAGSTVYIFTGHVK